MCFFVPHLGVECGKKQKYNGKDRFFKRTWPQISALRYVIWQMDKVNMSIAILPMAADFSWDSSEQGIIQSSIFWGYAATQVLGGLLATRFGQQLSLWMRFAMRLNQSVF